VYIRHALGDVAGSDVGGASTMGDLSGVGRERR